MKGKRGERTLRAASALCRCLAGIITETNGEALVVKGSYNLQKQDPSRMELRGRVFADEDGRYRFCTIKPVGCRIPMDGPVEDMVRAQGGHGWRPAHIHFLVGAPGHREAITAFYMADDEHIDSDTVFDASDSLTTLPKVNDPGFPFGALPSIHFDFTLASAEDQGSGRVGADPSQILQKTIEVN